MSDKVMKPFWEKCPTCGSTAHLYIVEYGDPDLPPERTEVICNDDNGIGCENGGEIKYMSADDPFCFWWE